MKRHRDDKIWLMDIDHTLLFYPAYVRICTCNLGLTAFKTAWGDRRSGNIFGNPTNF